MKREALYVRPWQCLPAIGLVVVMLGAGLGELAAQYPTANVVRRGLLRLGFEPRYTNYDQRFALNSPGLADGMREPIGADLTADTVGSNLFPSVLDQESAVRTLLDDPTYRMNVGAFRAIRDADIREFPLTAAFGLTERITLIARIPLVTFRSQIDFNQDTTGANVGWNPAIAALAGDDAANAIALLIGQLGAAIAEVQSLIDAGSFGCPGSAQCDLAVASVDRANQLVVGLGAMTGLSRQGTLPPFAPLASSAAGQAIIGEVAAVAGELQGLGATAITAMLQLPTDPLETDDINGLLSGEGLGFEADPLDFIRGTKLGDIELGFRLRLLDAPDLRFLLAGTARLPTGTPDNPDNFIDIGFGDGQTDFEFGIETAIAPTRTLGISFRASYTMQMTDRLVRRIATPDSVLVTADTRFLVDRNLGDIVTLAAYPSIRLADDFRAFGFINYYRKGADRFSLADTPDGPDPMVSRLERETDARALSFGGGLAYRRLAGRGQRLPIEAGLSYRSTFSGSGGLTPKSNYLRLHLRLFYRIFGGIPQPADPEPPAQQTGSGPR